MAHLSTSDYRVRFAVASVAHGCVVASAANWLSFSGRAGRQLVTDAGKTSLDARAPAPLAFFFRPSVHPLPMPAAKRRAQRAGIEAAGHSAGCVCGGFFDAATCERKRAEAATAEAKHAAAAAAAAAAVKTHRHCPNRRLYCRRRRRHRHQPTV